MSTKKRPPSLKELVLFAWAVPLVGLGSLSKRIPGTRWTGLMGAPGKPAAKELAASKSSSTAISPRESDLGIAIKRAARYLPGTHECLAQAIAGQMMLSSLGIPGTVMIGLRPDSSGPWDGHAWLIGQSGIVVGGEVAENFTPVTAYRKSGSREVLADG